MSHTTLYLFAHHAQLYKSSPFPSTEIVVGQEEIVVGQDAIVVDRQVVDHSKVVVAALVAQTMQTRTSQ
jgi:hypothetical protein